MTKEQLAEKLKRFNFCKAIDRRDMKNGYVYEIRDQNKYEVKFYGFKGASIHDTLSNKRVIFVTDKYAKNKGYYDKEGRFVEGVE